MRHSTMATHDRHHPAFVNTPASGVAASWAAISALAATLADFRVPDDEDRFGSTVLDGAEAESALEPLVDNVCNADRVGGTEWCEGGARGEVALPIELPISRPESSKAWAEQHAA